MKLVKRIRLDGQEYQSAQDNGCQLQTHTPLRRLASAPVPPPEQGLVIIQSGQ